MKMLRHLLPPLYPAIHLHSGESVFEAGDVTLLSGDVFKDVRVAYEVHGEMSAGSDNVILHPTSFGAKSADLRYRIGV